MVQCIETHFALNDRVMSLFLEAKFRVPEFSVSPRRSVKESYPHTIEGTDLTSDLQ